MGATVAVVARRGYETTRVADILELAGVSRSAYYDHFANKRECFLATLDALREIAEPVVAQAYRDAEGTWEEKLRAAFAKLIDLIVTQPSAARVWFVEAYSEAEGVELVERVGARVEAAVKRTLADSPERRGMPPGMIRGIVGGVRQVIHSRVRRGREQELLELGPDLLDWALGYETPSKPLRRPRKAPVLPSAEPDPHEQRARIVAAVTEAVAEKGYAELTITEIAKRAAVSLSTFYALFESKGDVFLAALDDGERRLAETVVPLYDDAPDWEHAIKSSMHAVFAFLSSNASMTRLGVSAPSAGAAALERQERSRESYAALLYPGFKEHPDTPAIATETIGGSISSLIFQHVRRAGAERLYEIAPTAVYIALAPFLGRERATAIANESWAPTA